MRASALCVCLAAHYLQHLLHKEKKKKKIDSNVTGNKQMRASALCVSLAAHHLQHLLCCTYTALIASLNGALKEP